MLLVLADRGRGKSSPRWGDGGADDAHDRLPDPGGVGLPRVEPGDDRLDGHCRRWLRRPPRQFLIRYQCRDPQVRGGGDVGAELLDALPGDVGLGGDVFQARRGEAAAGKGLGGGGEDLLPPLRAGGQPPGRLLPACDHDPYLPARCLLGNVLLRLCNLP